MKIPKEISEKIREANRLNNEICLWMNENVDCFEDFQVNDLFWRIVPEPQGQAQDNDGEEYCNQSNPCEDWYFGEYYWELEGESNYLELSFEC